MSRSLWSESKSDNTMKFISNYFNSGAILLLLLFLAGFVSCGQSEEEIVIVENYSIVETGQKKFYSDVEEITKPGLEDRFYGQDATYSGIIPSYTNNGDGTITDNVSGLMWEKSMGDKLSFDAAIIKAGQSALAGYTDWRVPTVKELYSLIIFTGQVKGQSVITFFIDTDYFEHPIGNVAIGEREIDAQT